MDHLIRQWYLANSKDYWYSYHTVKFIVQKFGTHIYFLILWVYIGNFDRCWLNIFLFSTFIFVLFRWDLLTFWRLMLVISVTVCRIHSFYDRINVFLQAIERLVYLSELSWPFFCERQVHECSLLDRQYIEAAIAMILKSFLLLAFTANTCKFAILTKCIGRLVALFIVCTLFLFSLFVYLDVYFFCHN